MTIIRVVIQRKQMYCTLPMPSMSKSQAPYSMSIPHALKLSDAVPTPFQIAPLFTKNVHEPFIARTSGIPSLGCLEDRLAASSANVRCSGSGTRAARPV